jgi:hypothetical protein
MDRMRTNTKEGAGFLHFPSPPNEEDPLAGNNVSAQDGVASRKVMKSQNLMDNFITIRVWLKIEEDPTNEWLKKLF